MTSQATLCIIPPPLPGPPDLSAQSQQLAACNWCLQRNQSASTFASSFAASLDPPVKMICTWCRSVFLQMQSLLCSNCLAGIRANLHIPLTLHICSQVHVVGNASADDFERTSTMPVILRLRDISPWTAPYPEHLTAYTFWIPS